VRREEPQWTAGDAGSDPQSAVYGDAKHYRQLWCEGCKRWMDRDVIAVLNISRRGSEVAHSKGEAGEAMVQEREGKDP
jgi:transposase